MESVKEATGFFLEQMYTGCLAEAAYYIESDGEAAVIDPMRETQPYVEMAEKRGARIKYVFETHFHADFVSGHVDLASRTGAQIVYGPKAETGFEAITATDGQEFKIGRLTIRVLHTPGHTPESSSYLLLDENGQPYCVFTGDTLFIGEVGRPDLAVKSDLTKEDLAGMLYDSLRNKLMTLPDEVIVYPAHGAGSACGKNISQERWSTMGIQKEVNYALQPMPKEVFVERVTEGIMPPPQYFPKNAVLNKLGYDNIDELLTNNTRPLSAVEVKELLEEDGLVIDTRTADDFSAGFIPGAISIGLDGSFASWVGTLVEDLSTPIVVITDPGREEEAILRLARVGYNRAVGYLEGGMDAWTKAGYEVSTIENVTPEAFAEIFKKDKPLVLDVRKPSEFAAEHVEDADLFPLDFINGHLEDLDREARYYVHCKGGYRSMTACSILQRHGYEKLVNVQKGFDGILKTDVPVTDYVCPSKQQS